MHENLPAFPHNLENEDAVLAAILVSEGKAFSEVASAVAAEEFYSCGNAAIFRAATKLEEATKPISFVTIAEQLREDDQLSLVPGGAERLKQLFGGFVTLENVGYHAKLIRRYAERRRWINAALRIQSLGFSDIGHRLFLENAERELLALTANATGEGPRHIKHALRELVKSVEARFDKPGAITGVPSGYERLDALTGGFQPGNLVIVAGRPGMGKTALAVNMILNAKVPGLVFSLEMSQAEIAERAIASHGRVDSMRLRSGAMKTADWTRLLSTAADIAERPIWLDDEGGLGMQQIRSRARRWRMQATKPEQTPIVMVDYIGLVQGRRSKDGNRQQEIADISRGLKLLAKELRCPVIALSQLNRSLESREDKRPLMSDLRESGAIEQDADVIAFIYRDEVYSKENCKAEDRGMAEVIVAKQRKGPTGILRLKWDQTTTRFDNA